MSKPTVQDSGTLTSIKNTGARPSIHWEGIFFLVIGLLLLFQEHFLATDGSGISDNYHALSFYFRSNAAILAANKIFTIPFLAFYLYATLKSTSAGLPRR